MREMPDEKLRRWLGAVVLQMPDGNDGDTERKTQRLCLGAVVLQMPNGNDGDAERKTQRLCFVFPLYVHFFSIFFTACSLFLLKLSFLSQKTSIFISKLHECASFCLSMCFFSDFFHNMFIVSSKATIFISKSFNFYFQTP
ncbi:hypothetical protein AAZX31_04G113300 [Glycine max]